MEMTEGIQKLTDHCKNHYQNSKSKVHGWGHAERTARGAVWFVEMAGGGKRECELAYVSGLLHDYVRPGSEKSDHARESADSARVILADYSEFMPHEVDLIAQAIEDHRKPVKWRTPLHQSVYLADKVLEHMGTYSDFRACAWAGELSRTDLVGMAPIDAVSKYYQSSERKFRAENYPPFVERLVDRQSEWNHTFKNALKRKEDWAMDLATKMFNNGAAGKDLDESLLRFSPRGTEQKKWTVDMRSYVDGSIFERIDTLIDR